MPKMHRGRSVLIATVALLAACADTTPVAPATTAQFARGQDNQADGAIATLQRVTARYHNLDTALAEGFVLLHPCESRPGEGPVGEVYVHMARLLDGVIDPAVPDALIYEPHASGPKLVGVEFAIPYPMWTGPEAPQFLGHTFQHEDEFGVYALHAWVWKDNPAGLFEETNPRITCGA